MQTLDFETLKNLAESDPEALEHLRRRMIEDLIQNAPEQYRRRLRGLQFRVDMEREKASTAMASCMAISQMMHNSFDELRKAIYTAQSMTKNTHISIGKDAALDSADILPFQR